ncbi:MAG: signal peptidase I [Acidimicrobiales bacterium]
MRRVSGLLAALVTAAAVVVMAGLALGYRTVIITTGSMGDTIPAGSLVIAAPQAGSTVAVGDVVVMQRPGLTPVTHRVTELHQVDGVAVAVTKGDANESADAAPYALEGEQLVARWSMAGLGTVIAALAQPVVLFLLFAGLIGAALVWVLGRVWRNPAEPIAAAPTPTKGRTRIAAGVALVVLVATTGLGWALFRATDSVDGNIFGAGSCYEAEVASVQSGSAINGGAGAQLITIAAVDPARSFVQFSVRSSANEPADSLVRGRLAGATSIEFLRQTDAGVAPPITIEWSVVEYRCGVSVQRGVMSGSGTTTMDATITAVDASRSFVLTSHAPEAGASTLDGSSFATVELADPTTMRFTTEAGHALSAGATYAWQVVEFSSSADAGVQSQMASLGGIDTAVTVTLPSPVDLASSFVLVSSRTDATGTTIEDRLVEAHLSSPTTVMVSRQATGANLRLHVQVVSLTEGSIVRHGTVGMIGGEITKAVSVDRFDPTRATAFSSVQGPGSASFGHTTAVGDDVLGAASATFAVTDAQTVTLTRDASPSAARWGWQLVEWGGPQWWDPQFPYRQRIDVDASTDASPNGYSVPLTFDHEALVTAGLARADGDDLRIVRWDGATWTELDRILDESVGWDDVATTLWFQTQDAIAANSTISYWMYYGDDTPTPPPADPENVWLLYETFESGTLGDFSDRTGGTAWYTADPWTRRIPITVDSASVAAVEAGMVVAVHVTDPALSGARADGADLRFTTPGGVLLPFEIESWDSAAGDLVAWVQLPTLSATVDTSLWLYFGAANAPDAQDLRAVWAGPALGVWHFDRDPVGPAPQVDDHSTGHLEGLARGTFGPGDRVAGIIGPALDFDGDGDVVVLPATDLGSVASFTLSTWFRADTVAADQVLMAKATSAGDSTFELRLRSGGALEATVELDGLPVTLAGPAVAPGVWQYVAVVWDGTDLTMRTRGHPTGTIAGVGSLTPGEQPLTLAGYLDGSQSFDGTLDETRLEPVARTAAWFSTTANNGAQPTFATHGAVEVGTWFDQGSWTYRKPVVVDGSQVSGTVTGFPVLVQITDPDLAAHAMADGRDVVFTGADGTTRLPHEIESWDGGTGTLSAWVKVPTLSAGTDETLFVYFGNAGAVDQETPQTVFGDDHDGVWHFTD